MTRILMATLAAIALSGSVASAQARASAPKPVATAAAPVNLNTATVDQLATIPGIGAKTAERIIEYRQKNGGFKKVEEELSLGGFVSLWRRASRMVSPRRTIRAMMVA